MGHKYGDDWKEKKHFLKIGHKMKTVGTMTLMIVAIKKIWKSQTADAWNILYSIGFKTNRACYTEVNVVQRPQ